MKPPKPTGFSSDTPPKVFIREEAELAGEPEDNTFEIKNPFLANLFHYGMIGILLLVIFVIVGAYLFLRSGGSISALVIGGTLGVIGIIKWIKSNDYHDKNKGGF